jgi:L-lactate utilization protein LutC
MTTSAQTPRTSRPLELAGPGERPATSNTQETTHMFTAQGSASLGSANHPSGVAVLSVETVEHCSSEIDTTEMSAIAESDTQLTGAFSTITEVGDAVRRIVGAA